MNVVRPKHDVDHVLSHVVWSSIIKVHNRINTSHGGNCNCRGGVTEAVIIGAANTCVFYLGIVTTGSSITSLRYLNRSLGTLSLAAITVDSGTDRLEHCHWRCHRHWMNYWCNDWLIIYLRIDGSDHDNDMLLCTHVRAPHTCILALEYLHLEEHQYVITLYLVGS
jgi:hypothetical protein